MRYLLFTIYHSRFTIHDLPFTIYHSLSAFSPNESR
jgi:hypothetical protein